MLKFNDKHDMILQPLIKWPGGKEKELKYIIPNLPVFENYYEPFVGGGAVFTALSAERYYINDLSEELICLYSCIAEKNKKFYAYLEHIDVSWNNAYDLFRNSHELIDIYIRYRNDSIGKDVLEYMIDTFCKERCDNITDIIPIELRKDTDILVNEFNKNLLRKMSRMKVLEHQKNILPEKDIEDNIETAIKGSLYMYYRSLYNDVELLEKDKILHCALFFFIRNYAYSGMFRYNSAGEFNVPYGGIAYNSKTILKKLKYYSSKELGGRFSKTRISNMDFEVFLRKNNPGENDFVFLDPPYDSEFSTYAKNEFTKNDQRRLAEYMINECRAKWMLIIKNTDFIYDLYNKEGINIKTFDKEYIVSFMNRNDKKVTHLLITNY